MSENDERVKDYWRIPHGIYIVKMIDDAGLEDELKKLNTMPLHLGAFVLSISQRKTNNLFMLLTDFIQMICTTRILITCILRTNIGKS